MQSPFSSPRHQQVTKFATAKDGTAASARISDSGATAPIEPESERWASLMRVTHASRSQSTESSQFCCYYGVPVQVTGLAGSFWVQPVNVKVFTSDCLPDVTVIVAEV